MNKKIASEIAVGVIVLLVIVIGGIFVFKNKKTQETNLPTPQQTINNQTQEPLAEIQKTQAANEDSTNWKLISGKESDTCSSPTFQGQVVVHGWYVLADNYGQKKWMLVLRNEDLSKLPMQPKFGNGKEANAFLKLTNASSDLENQLRNASIDAPVELTLKSYQIYCEGYPQVSVSLTAAVAFDKNALQSSVFSAVETGLKEKEKENSPRWDKKVDITAVDASLKAAKGKWWANDAWDWIGWIQNNGSWKILVSFDGFDCKELKGVPAQYNNFFREIIYPIQGKDLTYSKTAYCL